MCLKKISYLLTSYIQKPFIGALAIYELISIMSRFMDKDLKPSSQVVVVVVFLLIFKGAASGRRIPFLQAFFAMLFFLLLKYHSFLNFSDSVSYVIVFVSIISLLILLAFLVGNYIEEDLSFNKVDTDYDQASQASLMQATLAPRKQSLWPNIAFTVFLLLLILFDPQFDTENYDKDIINFDGFKRWADLKNTPWALVSYSVILLISLISTIFLHSKNRKKNLN